MTPRTSTASRHRVAIVAHEGAQSLDITGPAEVFHTASLLLAHRLGTSEPVGYDVRIVSRRGGMVATESAVRLDTDAISSIRGPIDSLVVPGGFSVFRHGDDPAFVRSLGRLVDRSDRLVSVCTGAHLLACTGALAGHTVATHWARARKIAAAHPDVTIDADPIFVHSPSTGDGPDIWSSAGVTAGIDLALALVERDHDTELAQDTARWLVMYLRRPGGQSQFATPTWIRQAPAGAIREAQDSIVADPGADHRLAELARRVAMSERHFVRRFTDEVGVSPGRFVAMVRIDAARTELTQSEDTVAAIARRCGFGTAETLRRSMQRHVGVSPDAYRQRFSNRSPSDRTTPPTSTTSSGKDAS